MAQERQVERDDGREVCSARHADDQKGSLLENIYVFKDLTQHFTFILFIYLFWKDFA